jgi:HlyD family secretion protein
MSRFAAGRVVKAAGWVLAVIAVAGVAWWRTAAPIPVVEVAPRTAPLVAEVFGTGTLEAKVETSVSAKIVGKVIAVEVDQGDMVRSGQVLARLEATDYADAVRAAEAEVERAQAELEKARTDLGRARRLHESAYVSDAEHDEAETNVQVAEARLAGARGALGVARARQEDTEITSSTTGLVLTRNLEVGSTVVPGTPIFRVADTGLLWVQAMVDERETGRLRIGQPARVVFEAWPDSEYSGEVARLGAEADRVTEEREVDVVLHRPPSRFFLGQRADVFIETARAEDALVVPKNALAPAAGNPGVFVVEHGRARWRRVKIGLEGREAVAIAGGLSTADRIIVNPRAGGRPLRNGARVSATTVTKERP